MKLTLPQIAAQYVEATNTHDLAAFMACFTPDAVVEDAGRTLQGLDAIQAWSQHEIMDAEVTVEVLDSSEQDGGVTITTRVDGTFDKTGLPDPLHIDHHLTITGNKIERLACRLSEK